MDNEKALDMLFGEKTDAKNQLLDLDLLVKSRFIEMFGDPKSNKMDWPIKMF